jgi:hypothetical protein
MENNHNQNENINGSENDVKEVKLVGEAAEFLEPKKTRKSKKQKILPNLKEESELLAPPQTLTLQTNEKKEPEMVNKVNSVPILAGTMSETSIPKLPEVHLTRKNKPSIGIDSKQTNQTNDKNKPAIKPLIKPLIKPAIKPLIKPLIKPIVEKKEEKKEKNSDENNEEKPNNDMNKTRKRKFTERRISINIPENDPKTRKARRGIKKRVATMSIDDIRTHLATNGLINKENKKIPEVMLRNMMKDSLLLASGK